MLRSHRTVRLGRWCRLQTSPVACPIPLPGRRTCWFEFGDNAVPGRLAFATLSLLVLASALNASM